MFFNWEASTKAIIDRNDNDIIVRDGIVQIDLRTCEMISQNARELVKVPWKLTDEQLATFAEGRYFLEGKGINWETVKEDWGSSLKTGWEKSGKKYSLGPQIDGIAISQPRITNWFGLDWQDSRRSSPSRSVGHAIPGSTDRRQ